jgi:hypothetical protein
VKYEDVVATNGRALSLVNPDAEALDEPLASRNARALDRDPETRDIAARLLESDNACWLFYSRQDVEDLFC